MKKAGIDSGKFGSVNGDELQLKTARETARQLDVIGSRMAGIESNELLDDFMLTGTYAADAAFDLAQGRHYAQAISFGVPKKKEYFIDFDYYIRMCLDLCKDFQIMEVRTTMD